MKWNLWIIQLMALLITWECQISTLPKKWRISTRIWGKSTLKTTGYKWKCPHIISLMELSFPTRKTTWSPQRSTSFQRNRCSKITSRQLSWMGELRRTPSMNFLKTPERTSTWPWTRPMEEMASRGFRISHWKESRIFWWNFQNLEDSSPFIIKTILFWAFIILKISTNASRQFKLKHRYWM